ncbi:MAG: PAS domain-containing protein [Planctomycetia bacterium]
MNGWAIGLGLAIVICTGLAARLVMLRQQLRDVREAFDVLAERAPIGILRSDARGMCTYANDTWCAISGLSREETLDRRWSQAVHPDDLAMVIDKWEASVREQRPYVNEVRLVRPDGSLRQVVVAARPTHDPRGAVTGFLGTALDVTDWREAESSARKKDSLINALVDHSSAAIYLKDLAGRYLLVNRRHAEIWPAMKDFRPGSTPFDWLPEHVAQTFIATDAEVLETAETRTFEETIPIDGESRTFLTVKFPVFDDRRQVTAVGGISADITDLERARRDLAERERLLRRLIEVQENEKQHVCHEFHDGLIQYAVGSKMLLEGLVAGGLPATCRPAVESVVEFLAKGIEDGRRVIRGIRPAALDDLGLRAALEEMAGDLRDAGIAMEVDLDPAIDAIPPSLQTTVYRIAQESLNNARKHSGSGRVSLGVRRAADRIEVAVEDWGRGFEPDVAASAGFGLAGIRERARLAGGQCVFETSPSAGTKIHAVLPLAAPESAADG